MAESAETNSPVQFSYDAARIFGLGPVRRDLMPKSLPGEVLIRYEGWSLQELRDSEVVRSKHLVWEQDWYNKHDWSKKNMPSGLYRLRIPVPDSTRKTFNEQTSILREREEVAPVCLVATALVAHLLETGKDLLNNDWARCREEGSFGNRVSVRIGEGRLGICYDYDEGRRDRLWLCSARKVH